MSDELKEYRVLVHNDSVDMLSAHMKFLANVSIEAANNLYNAFVKNSTSLKNFPYRCPIYPTRKASLTYRQLVFSKRYLIVFDIDEEKAVVNINYVLDTRQDNDL